MFPSVRILSVATGGSGAVVIDNVEIPVADLPAAVAAGGGIGTLYSWGAGRDLAALAARLAGGGAAVASSSLVDPADTSLKKNFPAAAEAIREIAANHHDVLMNFAAVHGYLVPEPPPAAAESRSGGLARLLDDAFAYGYIDRTTVTTFKVARWVVPGATAAGVRFQTTADAYTRWCADPPPLAWMTDGGAASKQAISDAYAWIAPSRKSAAAACAGPAP